MKRYLLLLFLAVSAVCFAEKVEPYKGSRIFWDSSSRKTVISGAGYSRIIKLQDGRLMACAEKGGIVIAFSTNNGNSWATPIKIVSNYNNINMCVPDLIQLTDGTIIVGYNPRPAEPYTEDRKFGIRCLRSTDNGATWSEEIFINDASHTFHDGCWEPSFLELPSGELQCYFADEGPYTSSGEQQISMCRSFDKGLTWGKAEKISFRAGSRDGMPAPILLQDHSAIVVAIEDNGWGYGDFFPTTVRCSLENNWGANDWVSASSPNRHKTLDFAYCPEMAGAAPYLCQLANGETVVSYQSKYGGQAEQKMWVGVGDSNARNFKALTKPFVEGSSTGIYWNSVAAIDTFVVAVGGVGGSIEMIKGYPKKQFEAALGSPVVDGKLTRNEGYYLATGTQVRMGGVAGLYVISDFAYDRDSLYFYARVPDSEVISSGANQDYIDFCVDAVNSSDTKPVEGTFRYRFRLNNEFIKYDGSGTRWVKNTDTNARTAVTISRTYYVLEAAIPWTDLGLTAPPMHNIPVNIYVNNGSATEDAVVETIPDAQVSAPWTWMPLHLQDVETGIHEVVADADNADIKVFVNGNQLSIESATAISEASVYSLDGRCVARYNNVQHSLTAVVPMSGMAVMKFRLANGRTVSRKVVL